MPAKKAVKKRTPAKKAAVKKAPAKKARPKLMATNRSEIPADELIKLTMGYKGGCISGKVNFLQSLGLKPVTHTYEATIVVKLTSPYELTAKDLAESLRGERERIEEGLLEGIAEADRYTGDYDPDEIYENLDVKVTTTPFKKAVV